MSTTLPHIASPTADDVVSAPRGGGLAVQVRYAGGSSWVTVARMRDRVSAVRRAASAYRSQESPSGALPYQVRIVDDALLAREARAS
jgi:hypothetical protein